jgi:hypothetical protein
MSATATLTARPARPLCDTRPARGKHRTRRPLLDRLEALRAHRAAAYLAATTLGGILAAVLS